VRRAIQHVRDQWPNHDIALVLPESERDLVGGWPGVQCFHYYRARPGPLTGALDLLRALRRERIQTVVVPAPPDFRSPHFQLFVLFAFLVKAETRIVMEASGGVRPLQLRDAVSSGADVGVYFLGLPLARLATALALFWARRFPDRDSEMTARDTGTLAILVPILPDLSHTFIYRELLSLLTQFGHRRRIAVVALEEGDYHPLHHEAKELLAHAVFVPACSLAKYLGLYLYYVVSRPRRMARLIASYGSGGEADPWVFLRVDHLHALHPSRGLALTRLLEKEGVGYIHCYGAGFEATRALVSARLLAVPFSLSTFVDFEIEHALKPAFASLDAKLETAGFVAAATEFCKHRLREIGGDRLAAKTHVIPPAIRLKGIYGEAAGRTAHEDRPPSLFAIGRLVEKKGLDYLIQACSILRRRGRAIRCSLVGEGPERRRLEALVAELGLADAVRFLGALPNHEIWARVGPQDICVVPSVYCGGGERDGLPVVLLEALARGHAVVATMVAGIPEVIADGIHGLLVAERDPDTLAAAIERLIADPVLRERLAAAGRRRVQREFDIDDKARQLWTLIEQREALTEAGWAAASRHGTGGELPKAGAVNAVIVSYNGAKFAHALFESLAKQTRPPDEVWLLDNASTDGSVELAEALWPGIKVVRYDRNTGYSYPVNEGIRRSRSEYQLVLNMDVVLEPTFIEEMVEALERYSTAGWAAGKVFTLRGTGKSDQIDCLGHHMARRRYATETDHSTAFGWHDYDHDRFVFGASACAALYRMAMLEDVRLDGEYFDEDFFAYFEDVDLDWRAQLRGWKCVYVPSAVGYHARGGSGLNRRPEIAACQLANRWLMILKNDDGWHIAQDLGPIVKSLARDLYVYGRRPSVVGLAIKRLIRLLPRALAKRRRIQAARVVPRVYLRSLIR
jgi:GT2 family glycosyltransferase/glycosyltransferase involved in cell wall biosynthesis